MTEARHSRGGQPQDPPLDGEIRIGRLAWLTVGLLVLIAVCVTAVWYLGFETRDRLAAGDPPPPALPEARVPQLPPGPRLQANPRQQLLDLRAEEDQVLTTYGWVDERRGIARVPIGRAMTLLVEQGLSTPASVPESSEESPTGN